MNIRINGESQEIQDGMSVAALLQHLDIREERVAVEINREILEKTSFDSRMLQDGDQVEILSFIGGGSRGGLF